MCVGVSVCALCACVSVSVCLSVSVSVSVSVVVSVCACVSTYDMWQVAFVGEQLEEASGKLMLLQARVAGLFSAMQV